jgi:hypothetical protein
MLGIDGVKMNGRMLAPVHINDDAKEAGDFRHVEFLF